MLTFRRPKNELESQPNIKKRAKNTAAAQPNIPEDMCISCPGCKNTLIVEEVRANMGVCTSCGKHFKLAPRERLNFIVDEGSFQEHDKDLKAMDPIDFPGYSEKMGETVAKCGEPEGVVCGTASIGGFHCCIFVMDPRFLMGSMGSVVGEKITRIFEYATEYSLPVIGYTVSGGARMQEGILSLMQMAKTSGAVKRHSDQGNLYVTVLTDPTTGGVTASFAMEGDIILSEPNALIGFAGPRVIEQTIRQKLPKGFQRAELLLEKGFIDAIVPRTEQKDCLTTILALHSKEVLL